MKLYFIHLFFTFSILVKLIGQSSNDGVIAIGLLPIKKPDNQLNGMNDYLESKILDLTKGQTRFKIIDNSNKQSNQYSLHAIGIIDSAKLIGATHLVQFTIHQMSFKESPNPMPVRFDTMNFQLRMESSIDLEMELFDVASGEIIASEKVNGNDFLERNIKKIPLEKVLFSKEKGMQSSPKSKKEIDSEKRKFLEEVEEWKKEVKIKATTEALSELNRKFRRLLMPDVMIERIVEESKEKAIKVAISATGELAFERREGIEVVMKSTIEFNGEKLNRDKVIGKLKFLEFDGGKAICKVTDGKEEVLAAFNKGTKLYCKID